MRGPRIVLLILGLIVLSLITAEGHRSKKKSKSKKIDSKPPAYAPALPFTHYSWTRDLGGGKTCRQTASLPAFQPVIVVDSVDSVLSSLNFQPTTTFFDFSTAVPIEVIAPVNGTCFIHQTPLTYNQVIGDLGSLNNTILSTSGSLSLDGTAPSLTPEQVAAILATNPSLVPICPSGTLIPLFPAGAAPVPFTGATDIISVLTQAPGVIQITVPQSPPPPPPPPPKQKENDKKHHRHHRHRH